MKKVAVFTGTRAEYGLLRWLMNDINHDPELQLQTIVTGMHLSPEFGETYREIEQDGFAIDEKVEVLLSSNTDVGVVKSVGLAVISFADSLARLQSDLVVILGDRFEALAMAQTCAIMKVPVLHLHGGEITEGAYDDAFRHAITKFSYLHAVSNEEHRNRVIQLGESPDRVQNVGAIGLDNLQRLSLWSLEKICRSLEFDLTEKYFLVTYHPVTLGEEEPVASFTSLLRALDCFSDFKVLLTYPNADSGGRAIIPLLENYARANPDRVCAIQSLGQVRYLSAVSHATAVIGNSSSGIIEVPSLKTPTVNIGLRQQGRMAANSVINCSMQIDDLKDAISKSIELKQTGECENTINPYWNGEVGPKVLQMIKNLQFNSIKQFHNL